MDELISELLELHRHWNRNPEFMYTARKCKEAADALEQAQFACTHNANYIKELDDSRKQGVERIEKLEAALHQAYLDGHCREDEATEMVGALSAGESGNATD